MPLWMAYDQTVKKIKGGIPEAASNSGDACFPCWRHVVTACTRTLQAQIQAEIRWVYVYFC